MFAGASVGAGDGALPEPLGDAAVAHVEPREVAVVEVLVDPVSLADVEERLGDRHRAEAGADNARGELGNRARSRSTVVPYGSTAITTRPEASGAAAQPRARGRRARRRRADERR